MRQLGQMGESPFPFRSFFSEVALVISDADQLRLRQGGFYVLKGPEEILMPFAQADGADTHKTNAIRHPSPRLEDRRVNAHWIYENLLLGDTVLKH